MKIFANFLIISTLFASTLYSQVDPLNWAKGAVWYQIFPERFHNGFTGNDPVKENVVGERAQEWQIHPWTSAWYKLQDYEKTRSNKYYDVVYDRRYGGDLIGVIAKLDYLAELGIDVIYFNPIFEARSLHKYDASTYHHIDNNFGYGRERDSEIISSETSDPATWTWTSADSVFLLLIERAHDKGIRIVIDGVFNHCGIDFWAFQDLIKNQSNSPYSDWFDVKSFDNPDTPDSNEFDYKGWAGHKTLPEFAEDDVGFVAPVKDYFFNITKRWMDPNGDGNPSDGVDGWRLDVALDVNPKFWVAWNAYVKSINPEAITVGEIWEGASEWIEKKRFDALMNYPFVYPTVNFFIDKNNRISVTKFNSELKRVRELYPPESNFLMMNLIGSHDTDRFASMIKNPDLNFDRMRSLRDNPAYEPTAPTAHDRKTQKLMILFQMTYLGAPMIYYGDEAGMWGDDDPGDRKPMVWSNLKYEDENYTTVNPNISSVDKVEFNQELFSYYKKIIALRKRVPALKVGDFKTELIDDKNKVYAFTRTYQEESVKVVFNTSESSQEILLSWPAKTKGSKVYELLTGKELRVKSGKIEIKLKPYEGTIISL